MVVETFPVGALRCNCTVVGDERTGEAIVIDPGDDAGLILERLKRHDLRLQQIICTHAHIDHVGAIHDLQTRSNAPASLHESDLFLFDQLEMQARWLGVPAPKHGNIDRFVMDGDAVACRGIELGVIHTPGHTPGSVTLHLPGSRDVLFTGDTLFFGSIGRTDLWGGSYADILRSIRDRLLVFDGETVVMPGHGPSTTIGREMKSNPFLR